MKNYKNQIVCVYHKQPITKIQKVSKKLMCPQCQQETSDEFNNRIQVMRAKLTTSFSQQLSKLKNIRDEVDRISQVFLNHNMVDAKRKIKKQLPVVQALIDSILDKEIEEANRTLRLFVQKLIKPWNSLDNNKFELTFIEFEKIYPQLNQQIQQKKRELKENISTKLKSQVSQFYCKLFDL